MGKWEKGVVLSDGLFAEFHKFKNGQKCDTQKVMRLLHFFKHGLVTNIAQYERTGVELPTHLKSQLRYAGLNKQSLEELARKTLYKVILDTEKNDFPYVNVMEGQGEKLENDFVACFERGESRAKALEHLKALCNGAKKIVVYDNYFSHERTNVEVLKAILPRKKMEILYYSSRVDGRSGMSERDVEVLKLECAEWTLRKIEGLKDRLHDRYLIIDGTVEVILTSGFDHLRDDSADFTYIVRTPEKPRLDE